MMGVTDFCESCFLKLEGIMETWLWGDALLRDLYWIERSNRRRRRRRRTRRYQTTPYRGFPFERKQSQLPSLDNASNARLYKRRSKGTGQVRNGPTPCHLNRPKQCILQFEVSHELSDTKTNIRTIGGSGAC